MHQAVFFEVGSLDKRVRILFYSNLPYKIVQWRFLFLSQKTPKNCSDEQKAWLCANTGPLTCSKYFLGSVLRFPQNHRSRTSAFPSRVKAKLRSLTTREPRYSDWQSIWPISVQWEIPGQPFRTRARSLRSGDGWLSALGSGLGWLAALGSGQGWLAAGSGDPRNAHSRRLWHQGPVITQPPPRFV